jgi:hypothetical protein
MRNGLMNHLAAILVNLVHISAVGVPAGTEIIFLIGEPREDRPSLSFVDDS